MTGKLHIPSTKTTMNVVFEPGKHLLEFSGISYPSNPIIFFDPVLESVRNYLISCPSEPITINFRMVYFNTSSSKYIFKILELFCPVNKKFNNVKINWYYNDEDALEAWKSLIYDLDLPFEIVYNPR